MMEERLWYEMRRQKIPLLSLIHFLQLLWLMVVEENWSELVDALCPVLARVFAGDGGEAVV